MRHTFTTTNFGITLRPIETDDAAFIVWLRSLEHVKGRLGDSAPDIANQQKWLQSYLLRKGDYYFIVQTLKGTPLGTHSVYNVSGSCAEVGRLVIRNGVPAGFLASLVLLDLVYAQMEVTRVNVRSVAGNFKAHAHIRKLGFHQVRVEHAGQVIGGRSVDILHFILTAEDWFRTREQLIPRARRAETWIREWEQGHQASELSHRGFGDHCNEAAEE